MYSQRCDFPDRNNSVAKNSTTTWRILLGLLAVLAVGLYQPGWNSRDTAPATRVGTTDIEIAIAARATETWVETVGSVIRLLPDDHKGSAHQRFILRLPSGHTVLVAHNLDLARRVPLRAGDSVRLRGRYEWNQKGGILHWTHHDPAGNLAGGWIEYRDRRYE